MIYSLAEFIEASALAHTIVSINPVVSLRGEGECIDNYMHIYMCACVLWCCCAVVDHGSTRRNMSGIKVSL